MHALKTAALEYASKHANSDGLALTAVPGLRMMCVAAPRGPLHSMYRPLVCLILQGAKHMLVGAESRVVARGESVIVTADAPVAGQIVRATRSDPYLAIALELDAAIIRDIDAELKPAPAAPRDVPALLVSELDPATLDCALRLLRLLDRPEAIPILHPGITRELHYWLLCGPHGAALRALSRPTSPASRLAAAIASLRQNYRKRLGISQLAKSAGMSVTAFHVHFKRLTSLTPIQFQKRLRLVEARRLLLHHGASATSVAFDVGYQSASQFTRDYARLFGAPPKRDVQQRKAVTNAELGSSVRGS
jgi:AraC-like DNA-binding protein